jgi:hypothetical protein
LVTFVPLFPFFLFLPFLTYLPLSFAVIYRVLAFLCNQTFHFHAFQEVHVLQHKEHSNITKHNRDMPTFRSAVSRTVNSRSVMLQTVVRPQNGETVAIQAVKIKFVRSIKQCFVLENINKTFKVDSRKAYTPLYISINLTVLWLMYDPTIKYNLSGRLMT